MGSGAWRSLPRWRRVSRTASCARPGPRWWQAGRPPPAGSRDRPASRREHAGAPRRWTGPCRGPSGRSRLRAVAQWSVLPMPGADEDLDVLDIHLSCRLSVKSIRGQPVDDRSRTHVCVRPHTQRAVPLISGHQRPAAAGDNTPRIICGQGQDIMPTAAGPALSASHQELLTR